MVWKPGSKHSDPSSRVIARRNDWNSICVLHQGPRSMAASRGRIHDRSPIACRNTKKTLAERGPSIHDGGGSLPRNWQLRRRIEEMQSAELRRDAYLVAGGDLHLGGHTGDGE